MLNQGLSLVLVVIAVLLLVVALRLLLRRDWIMAWLRGSAGLVALFFALMLGLAAADLQSYAAATEESEIALVGIEKTGNQEFLVRISTAAGTADETPAQYQLRGDLWQLDARVLTWRGPLAAVGMKPAYRLDRLSGRYLSLEQERSAERSVYEVRPSNLGFDFWRWLHENPWLPWIDADYGAATYMPLKDGAQYEVSLSNRGMLARPLNAAAVDAVGTWR